MEENRRVHLKKQLKRKWHISVLYCKKNIFILQSGVFQFLLDVFEITTDWATLRLSMGCMWLVNHYLNRQALHCGCSLYVKSKNIQPNSSPEKDNVVDD